MPYGTTEGFYTRPPASNPWAKLPASRQPRDPCTDDCTPRCPACGVLLCFPYPPPDSAARKWTPDASKRWYAQSSVRNHTNFTNMTLFALDESFRERPISVLDYGGGTVVHVNAGIVGLECYLPEPTAAQVFGVRAGRPP